MPPPLFFLLFFLFLLIAETALERAKASLGKFNSINPILDPHSLTCLQGQGLYNSESYVSSSIPTGTKTARDRPPDPSLGGKRLKEPLKKTEKEERVREKGKRKKNPHVPLQRQSRLQSHGAVCKVCFARATVFKVSLAYGPPSHTHIASPPPPTKQQQQQNYTGSLRPSLPPSFRPPSP